jgi:small GTP-binding protein
MHFQPERIKMIDVVLSIWDLGGQERFDFMKGEYLKGCAAIALCFDLSREDSFTRLNYYLEETRKSAGNIPILLVGNKSDLEDDLGEMIASEDIKVWMRNNQITDYIKCSAKTGFNVEVLFSKLTTMSLIDIRDPVRIGEYRSDGIFRFKMVLVGAGGVGKTSLVQRYANGVFKDSYKLTVGVDFITRNVKIDEELLPEETVARIGDLKEQDVSFIRAKARRDIPKSQFEKIEDEEEFDDDSVSDGIISKKEKSELFGKVSIESPKEPVSPSTVTGGLPPAPGGAPPPPGGGPPNGMKGGEKGNFMGEMKGLFEDKAKMEEKEVVIDKVPEKPKLPPAPAPSSAPDLGRTPTIKLAGRKETRSFYEFNNFRIISKAR